MRLRELAVLTQRQPAALLNVKASHIAYLESGSPYPSGRLILHTIREQTREDLVVANRRVEAD